MKVFLKNNQKIIMILSQIIIAITGLITGKIIAIYISPEDFGLYNIQFAIYIFFFSLLISPLLEFFKSTTKTLLPKIGYSFYLYLAIVLMLSFYLIALVILNFKYDINFYLILLLIIPSNFLFNLLMDYFNVHNRLNLFSAMNLLRTIGGMCFIGLLYFINYNYSDGSVVLWLLQIISFIIGILFFIPFYKIKYIGTFNISFRNFFKKYILFAWPLIILSFWSWITNFSDRFFIEHYLDVKQVGIYNANYSLGSKFFLLLSPLFLTLLVPNVYSNISTNKKKLKINKYAKFYILISILVLVLIYFTDNFIGLMLLSESYESGFYIIFWIAFAFFFLTLSFFYETIFYAEQQTKVILYSNIAAAIFNILLNIVLIPLYGLNGAIISTLFSFITRFIVVQFYFQKL